VGRANQLPLRPCALVARVLALSGMWGGRLGGRNPGGAPPPPGRPVGPLREMGSDFLPWLRKKPNTGGSGAGRRELCPGLFPTSGLLPWRAGNYFPRHS
jgi:hypothetical protein